MALTLREWKGEPAPRSPPHAMSCFTNIQHQH